MIRTLIAAIALTLPTLAVAGDVLWSAALSEDEQYIRYSMSVDVDGDGVADGHAVESHGSNAVYGSYDTDGDGGVDVVCAWEDGAAGWCEDPWTGEEADGPDGPIADDLGLDPREDGGYVHVEDQPEEEEPPAEEPPAEEPPAEEPPAEEPPAEEPPAEESCAEPPCEEDSGEDPVDDTGKEGITEDPEGRPRYEGDPEEDPLLLLYASPTKGDVDPAPDAEDRAGAAEALGGLRALIADLRLGARIYPTRDGVVRCDGDCAAALSPKVLALFDPSYGVVDPPRR